jgi:hypothetical protein
LQDFVNLETLYCTNNQLTSLDLSNNLNLISLDCANNQLQNLDLSHNTKLKEVNCANNPQLVSLKGGKSVKKLNSQKGKLNHLDLSQCEELTELNCLNNKLTNLDLSNCPQLQKLDCSNNQLLDITFPPDADQLIASEVIIRGNNQLDYKEIDKKFLKYLPTLTKSEIKTIEQKELEEIIKNRANIYGTIKEIAIFPA